MHRLRLLTLIVVKESADKIAVVFGNMLAGKLRVHDVELTIIQVDYHKKPVHLALIYWDQKEVQIRQRFNFRATISTNSFLNCIKLIDSCLNPFLKLFKAICSLINLIAKFRHKEGV